MEALSLCSVVMEKEGGLSTKLQATEDGSKTTAAAVHPQLLCSGNACSLDPHVWHTPQLKLEEGPFIAVLPSFHRLS